MTDFDKKSLEWRAKNGLEIEIAGVKYGPKVFCEINADKGKYWMNRAIDAEGKLAASNGTCRIVGYTTEGLTSDDPKRYFELSCGHGVMLVGLEDTPNYCAKCGAVVVNS